MYLLFKPYIVHTVFPGILQGNYLFLAAPKKSGESRKLGVNQIQGSPVGMLDYYMRNTNSTQDSSLVT